MQDIIKPRVYATIRFKALIVFFVFVTCLGCGVYTTEAQNSTSPNQTINSDNLSDDKPVVNDEDLKIDLVVKDLDYPTGLAFLGPNDFLILEKDKGTVLRVLNGQLLKHPLMDFNVSAFGENGLVGIAVDNKSCYTKACVYLYLTESNIGDTITNKSVGNHLYRYEFVNNQLANPKLLLELPSSYRGIHNGGKLIIGPDDNLYVTVGDIGRGRWGTDLQAQNNKTGELPDGTGGILRFGFSGSPVNQNIIGSEYPLNLYYAYGIRNSFGMDFDPLTGNLWDTENGDQNGDEINLVEPGFNSGWSIAEGVTQKQHEFDASKLEDFNGDGKYSDPEFAWYEPYGAVGPTALKFLKSDEYGADYKNDMFVGDFNYGNIYHFDLNKDRTELELSGSLKDRIANEDDRSIQERVLVHTNGPVIDIEMGPDGYLYFVSLDLKASDCDPGAPGCLVDSGIKGRIYRIVPK